MTFNDNVKLDPSQVEDVRGGRSIGGRTALAGGGGLLGIVVFVVVTLLGGSGSQAGDLGSLLDQALGQGAAGAPAASSALATECRTGADANARDDCRDRRLRRQHPGLLDRRLLEGRERLHAVDHALLRRHAADGVRARLRGRRAVLLPNGRLRLHRPWLLRRAEDEVRGDRWAVRAGVRPGPRVRAPRPGRPGAARLELRPGRCDEPVRPDRAPGRLPGRRLGAQRAGDRLPEAADRAPRSRTRWMRPRPSATTGSRPSSRVASRPSRGRTARPPSARSGSRRAGRTAP